jgi:uncharacterized protein (TIGR02271 family)
VDNDCVSGQNIEENKITSLQEVIMSRFFGLFGDDDREVKNEENTLENSKREDTDNKTLRLRKEELDISKNRVQVGEVELSKEIIEEQKVVDVPVTHEEVVIERRSLNNEDSSEPITSEESIHIPVSEEQVEVGKHTVITGEVSAHKRLVEENKHVEETLKREEAHVDTEGDADIINEDDRDFH